jgi:hypothetical protein
MSVDIKGRPERVVDENSRSEVKEYEDGFFSIKIYYISS